MKYSRYIHLLLLFLLLRNEVFAEEKSELELGVGIIFLSLPHYRGSDQKENYVAPIPYIRYEGKRLHVDREGGRFYLYNREITKLDLSTNFSFAVDSEDNIARKGMPDLKHIIELGPRLSFYLYNNDDNSFRFRVALPIRAAIATNFKKTESIGWFFSPYVQFRYYNGFENSLSIGPTWGSQEYHDYFYQVDPQYATVNRPYYDAKAGYSGSRITFSSSRRFNKIWLGFFASYYTLQNTVYEDSPLVKQNSSLQFGIALSYILSTSKN